MKQYLADYLSVLGDGRKHLVWIVLLMLCSGALDLVGLGLVAPLITLILSNTPENQASSLLLVLSVEAADNRRELLILMALLVVVVFSAKAAMSIWIQFVIVRFSESSRSKLMTKLLKHYLCAPWEFHLSRSNSDIMTAITQHTFTYSGGTLMSSMRLFADGVVFVFIGAFLIWTDWLALLLLMLVGVILGGFSMLTKRWFHQMGVEQRNEFEKFMQITGDSIGTLREIRLFGLQDHFIERLRKHSDNYVYWSSRTSALASTPRYLLEICLVIFMLLIGLVAIYRNLSLSDVIKVLGVFGVSGLRLMPASASLINSINSLRSSRHVLGLFAEDMRQNDMLDTGIDTGTLEPKPPGPFRELCFDKVSYHYPGSDKLVISNLSFTIRQGQALGIIGRTGSGRSTLADMLLGFLKPQSGSIMLDGRDIHAEETAWQQRLAYIPQTIYLLDDTLLSNVAFGVDPDAVDLQRLQDALEASQLLEVVAELPDGLQTRIGANGVRLSGGQRQRVELARALYHDRQIIVMDEATSALDKHTEAEVVREIERLHGDKTLIIIAHRLSTLEGCDLILDLEKGIITDYASLASIV
jgi:ABC-type multidrug transport system fused ATPase/permease subunit